MAPMSFGCVWGSVPTVAKPAGVPVDGGCHPGPTCGVAAAAEKRPATSVGGGRLSCRDAGEGVSVHGSVGMNGGAKLLLVGRI